MEAERAPALPDFTVRRSSRARRSRLTITDDGHAVVVLPVRASSSEAIELVARHSGWIARHVSRINQLRAELAGRPNLGDGRQLMFRGAPHAVVVLRANGRRSRVRLDGASTILVEQSSLDRASPAARLEAWLRDQARATIHERVAQRAEQMGVSVSGLSIRDQRTRWGSASRRGALSFNWRLILCPPEILDYVVVHELAHVRFAGHSVPFWRLVDQYVDSRPSRRWLREYRHSLRHALD